MELKKYLILDCELNFNYNSDYKERSNTHILKHKIVTGFTQNRFNEFFNITPWKPLGGGKDKLFFFSGCNIPRFKVRKHFSITTKPSKATAAFVNLDNISGSNNTFEYHNSVMPVELSQIEDWLDDLVETRIGSLVRSMLSDPSIEGIFLSRELWSNQGFNRSFTNRRFNLADILIDPSVWSFRHSGKNKPKNQLLCFSKESDLLNMTCDVHLQSDILNHLNRTNITIDEKKYEELRSFGLNGDYENLTLMMELMANSNYEESLIYLLSLLKEFGARIAETKTATQVNFKSLLDFIGIKRTDFSSYESLNIQQMTNILRRHKKFTRVNAEKIALLCKYDDFDEFRELRSDIWTKRFIVKDESFFDD